MKHLVICFVMVWIFLFFGIVLAGEETVKKELKPVLLVIDIQNQYLPWMASEDTTVAMPRINWLINYFRQKNLPIIRIYHDEPGQAPEPGDVGFEFPDHILVTDEDAKIIKNYGDSFHQTGLTQKLKDLQVNTVFLCGLSATGCVLATHFGASGHGFESFMIKDAIMSNDAEHTNSVEEIFSAIDLKTVKFMLDYMGQ